MNQDTYTTIKLGLGSLVTIGLYSVLYRENKFYRFCEHLFLGLATGWALVTLYTDVLGPLWITKMLGTTTDAGVVTANGNWAYIFLFPIGLMGYFVFSKKYNWMSRIPIGIILGFWSGQQIQVWWNTYGPQISASMKPILPNTTEFLVPSTLNASPEVKAAVARTVYGSQALGNLLFVITLLSVLSYFLFSFEAKNKLVLRASLMGRYLLMIGFGAIFGSTVMMRFTLLIDRMFFIFIEFFQQHLFRR
ncbi:MAG: hypothetical protein C4320_01330 [Armatimonadota bacterium]